MRNVFKVLLLSIAITLSIVVSAKTSSGPARMSITSIMGERLDPPIYFPYRSKLEDVSYIEGNPGDHSNTVVVDYIVSSSLRFESTIAFYKKIYYPRYEKTELWPDHQVVWLFYSGRGIHSCSIELLKNPSLTHRSSYYLPRNRQNFPLIIFTELLPLKTVQDFKSLPMNAGGISIPAPQ
jgi:hypothetical protein